MGFKKLLLLIFGFLLSSLTFTPNLLADSSCQIILVIQNSGFHNQYNNARSRCDALDEFFDVSNRCFIREHFDNRYEHNFRFERGFNGRGNNNNDARRNAFAALFNFLDDRQFHRSGLSLNLAFNNCS